MAALPVLERVMPWLCSFHLLPLSLPALADDFRYGAFLKRSALGRNHAHQVIPGLNERFGSLALKLRGQSINVHARLGELSQHLFAVSAISREQLALFSVSSQSLQRGLWHSVHREWRCQGLDVENVGGFGIFGSCACPQQSLRTTAEIIDTLPARRTKECTGRLVSALSDGDAKPIAQVLRHLAGNSGVPAADKHRSYGNYKGIEAGIDAPLNAAQECLRRGEIVFA